MDTALDLFPIPFLIEPRRCRKGTVRKESLKFSPPPDRKTVWGWFHELERWPVILALPARGRAVLAVLRSVIDFMDWKTGRLDPSYMGIAKKARYSRSTVAAALKTLRDLRVIGWTPCSRRTKGLNGQFRLEQETNAYILRPPSEWRGFKEAGGLAMEPEEWGATPPLPSILEMFVAEKAYTQDFGRRLDILELDPTDKVALTLARLGRTIHQPPPPH